MGKKRIILPLLLSLCTSTVTTAWASIPQDVTTTKEEGVVSGQVMDETGQPLPGVTIRIDGTNGGVASITKEDSVLRFLKVNQFM